MGRLALYMGLNEVKVFTPIPLSDRDELFLERSVLGL